MREIAILVGSEGQIGSVIKRNIHDKADHLICIDKTKDNHSLENIKFYQLDVSLNGLPLEVMKTIEKYSSSLEEITLINCIGCIESRSLVSISSNMHELQMDFKSGLEYISSSFLANTAVPLSLSVQFGNLLSTLRLKGNVINFSSVTSYGNRGQLSYSSSKAAVEIGTKVLAKEFGPLGIRFNCIAPGYLESKTMYQNTSSSNLQAIKKSIALRRFGDIQSIAEGVLFIKNCNFINGETIRIDGMQTI